MDQYQLSRLFDRLDDTLRRYRCRYRELKGLRANDFMLVSIAKGPVCVFKHRETSAFLRFDGRSRLLMPKPPKTD